MFHYYEKEDVHPAVADWLTKNGYRYEHEFRMPITGRADFVATHIEKGHQLIIECKIHSNNIEKAITQVLSYCQQLSPIPQAAVAIPITKVTDKARSLCALHAIQLIEVLVTLDEPRPIRHRKVNLPQQLFHALFDIAQQKSLEKITVDELANYVGIQRSTFYTYFQNIEELLIPGSLEIFAEFRATWEELLPTLSTETIMLQTFLETFLQHISKYVSYYKILLVQPGVGIFINQVRHYLAQFVEQHMIECFPSQIIADLPVNVIAHGEANKLVGMICIWLETGLQETPEDMAHLYYKSGHRGIWEALGLEAPNIPALTSS